jgi:transketolase
MPIKTKFEVKLGAATREAFGRVLVELGRENQDIVVCDADLSHSTMTTYFAKEFPDSPARARSRSSPASRLS